MEISLTKPNKSSPYFQLHIIDPIGGGTCYDLIGNSLNNIDVHFSADQLLQLKRFFEEIKVTQMMDGSYRFEWRT